MTWPHTNSSRFFRRLCGFFFGGEIILHLFAPSPHRYYVGSVGVPNRTPWYPWAGVPSPWSNLPPRLPFGALMILRSKCWRTLRVSLFWLDRLTGHYSKHSLKSNHTLWNGPLFHEISFSTFTNFPFTLMVISTDTQDFWYPLAPFLSH